MTIDANQVQKIADLAKLTLNDHELDAYTENLSKILNFVEQIDQYDTSTIPALSNPLGMLHITQPLRDDAVTEPNQRETMLALAPEASAGLYLVPKVIEE